MELEPGKTPSITGFSLFILQGLESAEWQTYVTNT